MAAGAAMQTPPFLTKLYQLVQDPITSALVSWTDDNGLSFTVHKPSEFGRDILPRYFKHNNFSSFVRQLNQYGFHKQNPDKWMFGHQDFRKDRPDLLKNITRRRPKQAATTNTAILPHSLAHKAIVEIGSYGIEGEVKSLKRDKDLLIQELVVTRRNEEQLRGKCDSLESRVSNLENSSKQMQAFIMHYFSQVLQPYSQAMASRKRKRLPSSHASVDNLDVFMDQTKNTVANLPAAGQNSSVDALRVMMQQMGVALPATPSPHKPPDDRNLPKDRPESRTPYAPATIQELPYEEYANGLLPPHLVSSLPRIALPGAAPKPTRKPRSPTATASSTTTLASRPSDAVSTPPPHTMPSAMVTPMSSPVYPSGVSPTTRSARSSPSLHRADAIANPSHDLSAKTSSPSYMLLSAPEPEIDFFAENPSTPNSNATMDIIDMALQSPKHAGRKENNDDYTNFPSGPADADLDPSEYEITFNAAENDYAQTSLPINNSKEDERALEQFLDLSGDDQPLPPPLTHLPEGTDIHALAKRIEGFTNSADA